MLNAGLLLIPQGVGSLAARFVVGKLVARLGARLVTIASFLLAAAATVPFALAGPHTSLWLLGAVLLIRGFGIGAVLIPPMSVAYQDVPPAGIPHATMNTRIASRSAPPSASRSLPSPSSPCSRTAPPAPSRARSGGRPASPSRRSSPLSRSPPPVRQTATDMQPLPATGGFSRGSRCSENTAVDNIPDNHSKQAGDTQTRRRGAELEAAILDAAWEQLIAEGYEHFTIDTVTARARTSKPVLYRRWKTREDLLRATVRHRGAADSPPSPDTGTLRGDLLALLTSANTNRNPMVALVSSMLGSYYNQTGPTPAELRDAFLSQRGSTVEQVVKRAVERGEIDSARLTPRIIALPFDLFRNEMMMTLKPVPDHVLRQIVDDIFIPLVTTGRQAR